MLQSCQGARRAGGAGSPPVAAARGGGCRRRRRRRSGWRRRAAAWALHARLAGPRRSSDRCCARSRRRGWRRTPCSIGEVGPVEAIEAGSCGRLAAPLPLAPRDCGQRAWSAGPQAPAAGSVAAKGKCGVVAEAPGRPCVRPNRPDAQVVCCKHSGKPRDGSTHAPNAEWKKGEERAPVCPFPVPGFAIGATLDHSTSTPSKRPLATTPRAPTQAKTALPTLSQTLLVWRPACSYWQLTTAM